MRAYKRILWIDTKKLYGLITFSCVFTFLLSLVCFAEEESTIQNLPIHQFPALIYTQEDLSLDETQRTSLMIASIIEGKADIQKIMTAQSINAALLSDTVFLLQANQYPHDSSVWQQTQFLIDFGTGSKVLLCKSQSRDKLVHYCCLRSVPEENAAVLLRYGQGTDRSTLIQVDLKTLKTKTIFTFPEKEKLPEFNGPLVKISPDFKQLAAIAGPNDYKQNQSQFLQFDFSLRVLNLETMKTSTLDDKVELQISRASSNMSGQPPFEWISPQEILYKNMIPVDWHQSKCVLKCANVKDQTITECLTKTETLTTGGGKILCDWFTKQVYYNEFPVDIKNKALLPNNSNCIINQNSQSTEVSFNGESIFNHDGYLYIDSCISRSKNNFAFFVRFQGNEQNALYIKTNDIKEPVIITQGRCSTNVIAWIENNGKEN